MSDYDRIHDARPVWSPPVQPGLVQGRPYAGRQKQINLGNRITLEPPNATPIPHWEYLGVPTNEYIPYREMDFQRILAVTAADYPGEEMAGSWVLTLTTDLGEPTDPPLSQYTPVVARVSWGAGGISNSILIDAWRSSISIPSPDVRVDVGYTQFGGNESIVGLRYPQSIVRGTIQRSTEGAGEFSTLTRLITWDGDGIISPEVSIGIPPFATAWSIYTGWGTPGTGRGIIRAVVNSAKFDPHASPLPQGILLDRVDETILDSMQNAFCYRPLPPNAGVLSLQQGPDPLLPQYALVSFRVGF